MAKIEQFIEKLICSFRKDVGLNFAEKILLTAAYQNVWPIITVISFNTDHQSIRDKRIGPHNLTIARTKLSFHRKQIYLTETSSN